MSNQNVINQLLKFGYPKHEIVDAMNHVKNENDINQVIDYLTVMSTYGWHVAFTSDGKLYYQNQLTKKTSWKNPLTAASYTSSNELPDGWKKCMTNDGKVYYQNNITRKTQWERPKSPKKNTKVSLPKGWRQCVTANGRIYYQNEITEKTQWDKPTRHIVKYNNNFKNNQPGNTMNVHGEQEEKKKDNVSENNKINIVRSWKNKKLKKWNNNDVLEWVNNIGIPCKWRDIMIQEIQNCDCTGKDIAILESGEDIGFSFGISNAPKLCDEIYIKIQKLKYNQQNNKQNNENRFKINIFSHGKTFTLNQSVSKTDQIYLVKRLYKKQSKVDAALNDIHLYSRSKLLADNETLEQVQIIDEKHLISVKFGADGAKSSAPRCICSKLLTKMKIRACYNGGSVSCDQCYEILDRINDEYAYHCSNKINSSHSQGYDLCVDCAEQ